MKTLLKKLLLFCSPILVWYAVVFITDPYEYFHKPWWGNVRVREWICRQVDYNRLYYIMSYKKSPKPNIILGSSLTEYLDVKQIPGKNWANFSMGGASILEEMHWFWHIAKDNKIDSVVFCVDPYNYLNTKPVPTVTYQAIEASESPVKYIMNNNVGRATFQILQATLKGKTKRSHSYNPKAKEAFWRYQMKKHGNHFKRVPDLKWEDDKMREVVDYCKENNITLLPIVPMMHKDVIDLGQQFKDERFVPAMKEVFGSFTDYWYVNEYTENRDHFGDPLHVNNHDVFLNTIWGNDKSFFRVVK